MYETKMKHIKKFNENAEYDILNIALDEDIRIEVNTIGDNKYKEFIFYNDNQMPDKEFIEIVEDIRDRLTQLDYKPWSGKMKIRGNSEWIDSGWGISYKRYKRNIILFNAIKKKECEKLGIEKNKISTLDEEGDNLNAIKLKMSMWHRKY